MYTLEIVDCVCVVCTPFARLLPIVCMMFVVQQQLQLTPTARLNGFHKLLVNSHRMLDYISVSPR